MLKPSRLLLARSFWKSRIGLNGEIAKRQTPTNSATLRDGADGLADEAGGDGFVGVAFVFDGAEADIL